MSHQSYIFPLGDVIAYHFCLGNLPLETFDWFFPLHSGAVCPNRVNYVVSFPYDFLLFSHKRCCKMGYKNIRINTWCFLYSFPFEVSYVQVRTLMFQVVTFWGALCRKEYLQISPLQLFKGLGASMISFIIL